MDEIQYPNISFWDTEAKEIEFINPNDFRRGRLLDGLGLTNNPLQRSFGVTDREEILRRQRNLVFLKEHKGIREFLNLKGTLWEINLPKDSQEFLNYFNPGKKHNPFLRLVHEFRRLVHRCEDATTEVASLVSFLDETCDDIEQDEREMANTISEKVEKAAKLEGILNYNFYEKESINYKGGNIYGYKKYALGLLERWWSKKFNIPPWAKSGIAKYLGPGLIFTVFSWIHSCVRRNLFYAPLIIKTIPKCLVNDIESFIKRSRLNLILHDFLKYKPGFRLFFRYSERGLFIRLVDVTVEVVGDEEDYEWDDSLTSSFPGFGLWTRMKLKRGKNMLRLNMRETRARVTENEITALIKDSIPGITLGLTLIESPWTDRDFKWESVHHLYEHPDIEPIYEKVSEYRKFFRKQMEMLRDISDIAERLLEKSAEWKKPLCVPEVLDNGHHVVSFETLEPIHLIGERNLEGVMPYSWRNLVCSCSERILG